MIYLNFRRTLMEGFKELDKLIEKANEVMGKKLTTKDRKRLPASAYCGPGRSFPCNDCSHVGAAKAFLGRSKFSEATKKKIAACINRKAKALGCSGDKKAKANTESDGDFFPKFIELTYEEKQVYSSDVFEETKLLVGVSIKNPGKDLEDCYGLLLK
jgi:hypothetical protein